ncbi:MAG: hypothetical protein HC898_11695 [Phycisphaerales bacterium]|nr:hypothetical protein [Phycisphaerales bacterium]
MTAWHAGSPALKTDKVLMAKQDNQVITTEKKVVKPEEALQETPLVTQEPPTAQPRLWRRTWVRF